MAQQPLYYKVKWLGSKKVAKIELLPLSLNISQHHKEIQLYIDFFFCELLLFSRNKSKQGGFNHFWTMHSKDN